MLELNDETVIDWLRERGLASPEVALRAVALDGGVSASVLAVTGSGVALVLKQPRVRLHVPDVWEATVERMDAEVAAARLLAELTPDIIPSVIAYDAANKVVALELLPGEARNWQEEIGHGRVRDELGAWAGTTLGIWHSRTAGRSDVAAQFGALEAFEQLRLMPFYETVMNRQPELSDTIGSYALELRRTRRCFVHGDYAPKNILVEADGRGWVLDFEVAHWGNPVFDVAFFLSFVVLSAVRWPPFLPKLRSLGTRFMRGYESVAGEGFAGDVASVAGHTACLMLARTDGTSPASFLDEPARGRARTAALAVLSAPQRGLWSWC